MPNIDPELQKEAVKAALKEWLDQQFAAVGRWTVGGLISIALVGIAWLFLASHGWKP